MRLNGWRRIAVVLSSLWVLGVGSFAGYEAYSRVDGAFVGLTLPSGTIVAGSKATLPGGRTIDLNISIDGRSIKPWNIKWDNEPEVPTELDIYWPKLLLVGLAFPILMWGFMEILAFVIRWISTGFSKNAH